VAKSTPKVGNSNIGTGGNPGTGGTSSEGVQWPHMPSVDSYGNAKLGSTSKKSGKTANNSRHSIPELPENYSNGMNKGKK